MFAIESSMANLLLQGSSRTPEWMSVVYYNAQRRKVAGAWQRKNYPSTEGPIPRVSA
jgi:hypothetical protein